MIRSARLLTTTALAALLASAWSVAPPRASGLADPLVVRQPPDVSRWLRVLGDRRAEDDERTEAARRLARYNEPRARRSLERALRDPSAQVRSAAALSLGQVGDARSIRALERRQSPRRERVASVRAAVGHSLARLRGESLPRAVLTFGPVSIAPQAQQSAGASDEALSHAQEGALRWLTRVPRLEVVVPTATGLPTTPGSTAPLPSASAGPG